MKLKKFKCKFCKSRKNLNYRSIQYPNCKIKFCRTCNVKYFFENKITNFNKKTNNYYINEIHYYFNYKNNYYAIINIHNFLQTLCMANSLNYSDFDEFFNFKRLCYTLDVNRYNDCPYFDLFKNGYKPHQVEEMFLKFIKLRNVL